MCANCAQSGLPCTFTKSPAKRGPNKGYIQQLETRLAALESHNGSPSELPKVAGNGYGETNESSSSSSRLRPGQSIEETSPSSAGSYQVSGSAGRSFIPLPLLNGDSAESSTSRGGHAPVKSVSSSSSTFSSSTAQNHGLGSSNGPSKKPFDSSNPSSSAYPTAKRPKIVGGLAVSRGCI